MSTTRKRNHEELTTYSTNSEIDLDLINLLTQEASDQIDLNSTERQEQVAEIIKEFMVPPEESQTDTSMLSQENVNHDVENLPEEIISLVRSEVELANLRNRYSRDETRSLLNKIEKRNNFRFDPTIHNAINIEKLLSENANSNQGENVKKRIEYLNMITILFNKKMRGLAQRERNGQMSKEDLSTLQNFIFTIQAEIYVLLCDNPGIKCDVKPRETILQPINAANDITETPVNPQAHFLNVYPQFTNHPFFTKDNGNLSATNKTFPVNDKIATIQYNAKHLSEVDTAEKFQKIWSEDFRAQCWLNGHPYKDLNGRQLQVVTDSLIINVFLNAIKLDVTTSILNEILKDNKRLQYLINRKGFHLQSHIFLDYILCKSAMDDHQEKIIVLLNYITEKSVLFYLHDEILKALSSANLMSVNSIKNLWEIAMHIESGFPKVYRANNENTKVNEETSLFYTYKRHS